MDAIQLGDPGAPRRVARAGVERFVVEGGDAAGRIGHRQRDAEMTHLVGERKQRIGRRAFAGIVQSGEDVTEQAAGFTRVVAEVAGHDPGVPDRQHAEQQRGGDERGGTGAAERASKQCGQCRHTAPTPAGR